MAATDSLTGLYNRHVFDALMPQAISEAKRSKKSLITMLIDIDHFKTINDSFGHITGDQVIKDIASLIRKNLRASDIVFRWGGEEYLVILKDCPISDAQAIAEKLRASVEEIALPLDNPSAKSTLSIGIAALRSDDSPDDMIVRADAALYTAKNRGRNCVCNDSVI